MLLSLLVLQSFQPETSMMRQLDSKETDPLVVLAKERQQTEEDVDNIYIQLQGTVDVFLRRYCILLPADNHLSIEDQEQCKYQSSKSSIHTA